MKHGEYKEKLYERWQEMKLQCYWEKHSSYKRVGGKGIRVHSDWIDDYQAFEKYAKSIGYQDGEYLHRKNSNKDFEPGNIFFAHFKPSRRYLTYEGETKTITEWSRTTGLSKQLIHVRLKRGWTIGQALGYEETKED